MSETTKEEEKYFYIHTFGCQMNVHDSEQLAVLLERDGYSVTDDMELADLIIINTCSVREKAEQKAHSLLGRVKPFKKRNPELIVGVIGCLAQQWGKNYFTKAPQLDFVCGTHNINRIPRMIRKIKEGEDRVVDTVFRKTVPSLGIFAPPKKGRVSAYVTIMQGCNNFCSYCIVPYVRGREESRPANDIIAEIRGLVEDDVKEVTLLGQNVNSYGATLSHSPGFPDLLKMISEIEGVERIRFTTSHPKDLSRSLIRSFSEIGGLCEHIHLPVQAGSNEVLKRMRRGYTAEEYIEKVEMLKMICPGISITSDIIVGFPGENGKNFQKTIDLMEKVRFDGVFSFKYSDRFGTTAAKYNNKVEEDIKSERLKILQSFQNELTLEKHKSLEGEVMDVLVEGKSKSGNSDVTGRTRTNKVVNFEGSSDIIGKTVAVRIVRGYAHSLRGEALSGEEG